MIVEVLISAVSALVAGLGSLFGTIAMPGWWDSVDGWLDTLTTAAAGYGKWVPLQLAVNVAGFVFVCLGVAFTIKLVRIVASFFTAGGGSAA